MYSIFIAFYFVVYNVIHNLLVYTTFLYSMDYKKLKAMGIYISLYNILSYTILHNITLDSFSESFKSISMLITICFPYYK